MVWNTWGDMVDKAPVMVETKGAPIEGDLCAVTGKFDPTATVSQRTLISQS